MKKIVFLGFLKVFSLENKGFKVLNNEKKMVCPNFSNIFSLKNKSFRVLKNEKGYFLIFQRFFR